jgi:DNA polymerase III delta prime subunit
MTYIVVNKSKEIQRSMLQTLLTKLYGREIDHSPDIHILNLAEKNSIGVEQVKEFQKKMMYKPFQEKIQTSIIMEGEKMTHQAQNSLLKTLEESPSYTAYIICADNEKNLLPTITSRGHVIYSPGNIQADENSQILDESILDLPIVQKFEMIEGYAKEKTSSLEFINNIEEIFRHRLELDIKNGKIESSKRNMDILKKIDDSRMKISANCNRRLVLEALIVTLET